MAHADREQVHVETRHQWRRWLEEHHATSDGVWLVSWRTPTGRPRVDYEDAVEEALCFGWIDSTARTLDEERGALWFAPRRPGSGWAPSNKLRVVRLEASGLMTEAGRRVIDAAKADGSWTKYDTVDQLLVPDDLAEALAAGPGRAAWDALAPSARRALLAGLVDARTPATRSRRVAEAVRQASDVRPNR